jgi:uncharacterized protein (DUF1501 family)
MDRRKFLRNTLPAVVLPTVFNGLGIKALGSTSLFTNLVSINTVNNDNVLVMIQLSGGNDGLNTVIPLDQYAAYNNARANVAIPENRILRLNGVDTIGFHPSMTGMQELFAQGKLSVIQSAGYPDPDFSHFRATDIWVSASDSNQILSTGWSGRFLNYEYPNYPNGYPNPQVPDPLAVEIGAAASFAFQGPNLSMSMNIKDPNYFYQLVNDVLDPAPPTPAGKELNYIRTIARQTEQYTVRVKAAYGAGSNVIAYPGGNYLAEQLKIVARLIKGGLKTKMYLVHYDGFDTHAQQVNNDTTTGAHATLLKNLSESIKVFQDDLQALGVQDRVMGMTFSEFGRRVKSNNSAGTDHGAAAPIFVFGSKIQPKAIIGSNPLIPANASVFDNIPMEIDFRSVYSSILHDWIGVPGRELNGVLLKNYQTLPLIQQSVCKQCETDGPLLSPTSQAVQSVVNESGKSLISAYPETFVASTTITYQSNGGHTLVQIFNGEGKLIKTLVDEVLVKGSYKVAFENANYTTGTYYVRFQNGSVSQMKMLQIVK